MTSDKELDIVYSILALNNYEALGNYFTSLWMCFLLCTIGSIIMLHGVIVKIECDYVWGT